jgi:hypothetical protein
MGRALGSTVRPDLASLRPAAEIAQRRRRVAKPGGIWGGWRGAC